MNHSLYSEPTWLTFPVHEKSASPSPYWLKLYCVFVKTRQLNTFSLNTRKPSTLVETHSLNVWQRCSLYVKHVFWPSMHDLLVLIFRSSDFVIDAVKIDEEPSPEANEERDYSELFSTSFKSSFDASEMTDNFPAVSHTKHSISVVHFSAGRLTCGAFEQKTTARINKN